MEPLTGFVIAGGKSTRMGRDKAFLELGSTTLLSNALRLAKSVAGEVRIVGDPAKFRSFGSVVPDVYPERGPLGGIHAALEGSSTDLNLILGVDLPFLETKFLEYLISTARESKAVVTVPRIAGYFEPLCAAYRKQFVILAEKALAANRNKIDALFADIPLRVVNDQELAREGFLPAMFRNVNTPEDWKAAQEAFARDDHVS